MSATTSTRTPARPMRAASISRTLKARALILGIGFSIAVPFSQISQWHTMTAQHRHVLTRRVPR